MERSVNNHIPAQIAERSQIGNNTFSQPILLTIPQAAQQLGLSKATIYRLIAAEGLPTIRLGRATRIAYTSLVCWVQQLEKEQNER